MNTDAPIAAPSPPGLRGLLDGHKQEIFQALNCHLFGTITAFKIEPEFVPRVSVQIASKKVLPDGSIVDYPLLTDCPVFTLMGGKAFIQMPIAVGDPCLVLFHDTDIDNWWVTGNSAAPNSRRSHSLSDGMVLVGFPNMATPLGLYSADSVVISDGVTSLVLDPTGGVTITTAGVPGTSFIQVLPSGIIQIKNAQGSILDLGSSGNIGASAQGKFTFYNASASLGPVLDSLATLLTSWVNTGGSTPNPATVAAIAAFKAAVDSLLY